MTPQERKARLERVGCKNELGKASKMPCATYSLPASACKLGQMLAKLKNSTCSGCYADGRGNYSWPNVVNAMNRRLSSIGSATWVEDMTELIRAEKNPYFRWHDSGDIQSVQHLVNINQIALNLPDVKFWLPTREAGMVSQFMRQHGESKAANLIIRLSAAMVNGKAPDVYNLPVSYVHTGVAARFKGVRVCPAPRQEGRCGECRNCWNPSLAISYHKH